MVDLVIVGSIALDDVKTPFGEVKNVLGGSIVFAGCAAAFFSKPGIVGIIGSDFPQEHLNFLAGRGIDIKGIETRKDEKTFRWQGFYEYDMNEAKTLKTELNAFSKFQPKLPEEYKKAKYVFLGNIGPELQIDVLKQVDAPEFVIIDTMNYWIERSKESVINAIKKSDCALMNDAEARQLFGIPNLAVIGKKILELGPKYAVIKKGEHGALLFTQENGITIHFNAPGYPLENVIDPTGAGDSFAGAMLGYIAKTKDTSEANIRKAVIYGSVLASFNAEGFSVNNLRMISKEDIENRFKQFQEIRNF